MPFVKIDRSRVGGKYAGGSPVSMAIYNADGKKYKARSVAIRFEHALVQELWPHPDTEILRLSVYEGTGADKGFLSIHKDDTGYIAGQIKSTGERVYAYSIAITQVRFKHYVLNDTRAEMAPVQFVVDDGAILVECPDWLCFNPLSAPEEALAEPEPVPVPEPEKPAPKSTIPFTAPRILEPVPQPPVIMHKRPRGRPPKGGYRHS